jgi:hypothetical protein
MHAIGDGGIAQAIGEPCLLQHVLETHLHVIALWELRPQHDAELDIRHEALHDLESQRAGSSTLGHLYMFWHAGILRRMLSGVNGALPRARPG